MMEAARPETFTMPKAVLTAVFAAVAAALLRRLVRSIRQRRQMPPGPPALPLVGSNPWITSSFRRWMLDTPKLYGPICSFRFSSNRFVCINTYEGVKEALIANADKMSGRMRSPITQAMTGNNGLLSGDGEQWRRLRRFSLQSLRDFGLGKAATQSSAAAEANDLCSRLRSAAGRPVSTAEPFSRAVSNVICQLVFGRRLGSEEELADFEEKLALINGVAQGAPPRMNLGLVAAFSAVSSIFPSLMLQMPFPKKLIRLVHSLLAFSQQHIDSKKSSFDTGAEPRDYIEAFLLTAAADSRFTDKELQVCIVDLFIAGTDTTANSLRWMVLHLALHPDLQQRLWLHINQRIGRKTPQMSDRAELPLVEAFLHELQRCYTLVPLSVAHRCTEDTRVQGFLIPAGTIVQPNLRAVHSDPAAFPQPELFDPDRFLDDAGRFVPSERVIPFSIGRRSCLGESLAKIELFVFTVVLLQNFSVSIPEAERRRLAEICEYDGGVVHAPKHHLLVFTDRESPDQ